MASNAALTATELALLALDMPIIGVNALPRTVTGTERWCVDGLVGGTDKTLAANPGYRAHDGIVDLTAKGDTTSDDPWYFVFSLGTSIEFDFVSIVGHNFYTLGVTQVDLEIDAASVGDFASLWTIPIISNPASNDRIMQLDLKHTGATSLRYSGVGYCRLKVTKGGNFAGPAMGELILGRRYQQKSRPTNPFNPNKLQSIESKIETRGGLTVKNVFAKNRFVLDARFTLSSDTYSNNAVSFWSSAQTNGSMIWIWKPQSAPNSFHVMSIESDSLELPSADYCEREFTINAVEQGPEAYYLANE